MDNTDRSPEQLKVLIEEMSKTIQKLTSDLYLKAVVNSVFDLLTVSDSIQQLKAWNNTTNQMQIGEKAPQTDIGDQFIF